MHCIAHVRTPLPQVLVDTTASKQTKVFLRKTKYLISLKEKLAKNSYYEIFPQKYWAESFNNCFNLICYRNQQ